VRYHNITRDDMKNGPGLRVVLWLAGCAHRCEGCHNPFTWDADGGLPFTQETKNELFDCLDKPYISGLTLSGGDPMFPPNREDVCALIKEIKAEFPHKTIWMYTGYTWEEICDEPVIRYLDVVLDGPFVKDLTDKSLHWVGSSNQRVIEVPQTQDNVVINKNGISNN